MGARFGGVCYADASSAADALWSGVPPVVSAASPPVVVFPEFGVSGWQLVTQQGETVIAVVPAPEVAFAECSAVSSFVDGTSLGWYVFAAMAVAFIAKQMGRGAECR